MEEVVTFATPSGAHCRLSPAPEHLVERWGEGAALELWVTDGTHRYATVYFSDDNLATIAAFIAARNGG